MPRKPKTVAGAQISPLVMVPIGTVLPNPRNPRRHSEKQIERLMASLRRDGQTKPVLLRAASRMLIAGHGVTDAARRLGMTEIKAILWDIDQATADRVMLADNRLSDLSESDDTKIAELLREIDQDDLLGTGFTAEEAAKLLDDDTGLEIREIDTYALSDEFRINVRGPLAMQAQVLQRIKQLLGEFKQVAVDVGTIASD